MIERIARVVPAPPDKPVRPETALGQQRARRLALNPGTWDRQEAADMRATFDEAASGWDGDRGGYRRPVLADALARGGPFPPGLALEIASGTGLLTPLIQAVWPTVVAVDLSAGMLARSAAARRLQADAAHLPLVSGCADAVVIGDGPLFAPEVARVMTERAVLVLSNALGRGAPFYVPTEVVAEAMTAATGRPWDAVESQAHWGSWAVLRRAGGSGRGTGGRLRAGVPTYVMKKECFVFSRAWCGRLGATGGQAVVDEGWRRNIVDGDDVTRTRFRRHGGLKT